MPEAALTPSGQAQYVYRVRDGVAERRAVTIGERREGLVEILTGVGEGDQLVVAGLQRVTDGAPVQIGRRRLRRRSQPFSRRSAMRISETCIQRPVFASVLSLIIVLIGLISYSRLTVREYPKIDEPIVSVDTTYKGASPEVIESQVTKPLEDQLAGIEGVDVMTSRSRPSAA